MKLYKRYKKIVKDYNKKIKKTYKQKRVTRSNKREEDWRKLCDYCDNNHLRTPFYNRFVKYRIMNNVGLISALSSYIVGALFIIWGMYGVICAARMGDNVKDQFYAIIALGLLFTTVITMMLDHVMSEELHSYPYSEIDSIMRNINNKK